MNPRPKDSDIRPQAVRVHLGPSLIKYHDQLVDPMNPDAGEKDLLHDEIDLEKEPYILKPGEFVLGSTIEEIKTPRNICGFLDGRSTLARLGITIHISAAVTDGLYDDARTITLEIHNASNMHLKLSHTMPIGSLLFSLLDQDVAQDVQSQYKGQNGATIANLKGQFA